MKKTILLLSAILIFAITQTSAQNYKRYYFKSGIIEYKYDGKTQGTETVYFDDYGYYEAVYTETVTKMMGIKAKVKTATITIGDDRYEIDFNENTAVKMKNPLGKALAESKLDWVENSKKALQHMGFQKTGTGTVLGKTCDIWEGTGKAWVWKGLTLKTEVRVMGLTTVTATDVKTDVNIPDEKFKVPAGIKITEQNVSKEEMQEGMESEEQVKSLKDVKNLLKGFKKKK